MQSRLPAGGAAHRGECAPHRRCRSSVALWGVSAAGAAARPRRRPRTVAVRAERSLYEVLGVAADANDRDIKKAFRQKALKLHPDVNKAPDAEARFMEAKAAFGVLSDPVQRAEYDRRQRAGSWGSWRPGSGASSGGGYGGYDWGGSGSGGAGGRKPPPQEEYYGLGDFVGALGRDLSGLLDGAGRAAAGLAQGAGSAAGWAKEQAGRAKSEGLEDFFRDLEKEAEGWARKRSDARKAAGGGGGGGGAPGRAPSLWDELAALGEEFVEYLESTITTGEESGADDKAGAAAKGKEGGGGGGAESGSGGGGRRSPLDEYEALKKRYGIDGEGEGGGGTGGGGGGGARSAAEEAAAARAAAEARARAAAEGAAAARAAAEARARSAAEAAARAREDAARMRAAADVRARAAAEEAKAAGERAKAAAEREVDDMLAALKKKLGKS
ncbi:MAG: hypothetical protein J3K34DRAFT_459439 [Monoraphidium minutum]|nr:MAG: hypothetical protein J3K34DRAFT_459439 [Monoraphidium minutum]